MKTGEIRERFLKFFEGKGHTRVPSSSLVVGNDPTLLFANSGMVPFKDLFLGAEKRAYTRATSSQKSLRIAGKHNDFENVGVTARHHTFFEMLGNFSFGDYFKAEAISYAWDFVIKELKFDIKRIWVTIFQDDDEAFDIWAKTGISKDRIVRLGAESNFWQMGDVGPCGPSSEIFCFLGDDLSVQSEEDFKKDDGRYIEIWNLVFMQFERDKAGELKPLPKPSIDTGMGVERTAAALTLLPSNYDTDVMRSIIATAERLSGFKYDGKNFEVRDLKTDLAYARDVAMRVIADHTRAIAFLIADGVRPASDGRGYVLRRLIRRAARHARVLGLKEPFLKDTCATVIKEMHSVYPELKSQEKNILEVVFAEEQKFAETLDSGMAILRKEVEKLKKGEKFPGKVAFQLHDTYGFPLDLTEDALKPYGVTVDVAAFEAAMTEQRERSRDDRKGQEITYEAVKVNSGATKFLGYTELSAKSKLTEVVELGGGVNGLVFDATPFYGESGGQVGDIGEISFADCKLRVVDTQKIHGAFVHRVETVAGEFGPKMVGKEASLLVDKARRDRTKINHSATHVVHAALRNILGTHVAQAGSRVDGDTLRFDYSHHAAVTDSQLSDIHHFAAAEVLSNHAVETKELPIEQARKTGAVALFGEKYGDIVRVVFIGPKSIEFCGGTHVSRSGDIGGIYVLSEGGISSGVRRIECVAGIGALEMVLKQRKERLELVDMLKGGELTEKVEKMMLRIKTLEKEVEGYKARLASNRGGELIGSAKMTPKGVKVVQAVIEDIDLDGLKTLVDTVRNQLGSGVVVLAANVDGQGTLVAGVTKDLTSTVHAGNLIKEVIKTVGGKGGGRPDFAQAGGMASDKLTGLLERAFQSIA
jgi:alanyl-tRNA synthetase